MPDQARWEQHGLIHTQRRHIYSCQHWADARLALAYYGMFTAADMRSTPTQSVIHVRVAGISVLNIRLYIWKGDGEGFCNKKLWPNSHNPVCNVATICCQICCMYWSTPLNACLFKIDIDYLMGDILYRFIRIKYANTLPMDVQPMGTRHCHSRLLFEALIQDPTVSIFMDIEDAPQI